MNLAPTLPAARGSLPPEGAAAPAARRGMAPTLPAVRGSLPPEGALRLRPGEAGSAALAGRGYARLRSELIFYFHV